MQLIKNLDCNKLLWLLTLLLALALRVYGLGLNPVGLSHDDELHEIINAKSLALTGEHAPGRVAGILTQNDQCTGNCVYGELGSYILIPWMKLFPLDLFWSKLPFALVSVGIVFFGGKLFEHFSKNKAIGLLTGLFIAINPWEIHVGRMAYFTIFSYFFYLVGLYFFTSIKSYRSNLIFGSFFTILGSLFYFGTKPLLPFIISIGFLCTFYQFKKIHLKFTLLLSLLIIILSCTYFILLSHSYAGRRLAELSFISQDKINALVDYQRQTSLNLPFVSHALTNKYTVISKILYANYLNFFSPVFLYIQSEGSPENYYISGHAYNYLTDLPFVLFGLIALSASLPIAILILALLAFSAFPAVLKISGGATYTWRAGLAFPILSGITAWGCYFLYSYIDQIRQKYLILKRLHILELFIILVGFLYLLSLGNFLFLYWFRTPFEKNIGYYFHKRVAVNYAQRLSAKSDKPIIVITAQPADTFNTYIFFSRTYNDKNNITEINKVYSLRKYSHQGISFFDSCDNIDEKTLAKSPTILIERDIKCSIGDSNGAKIANSKDSGGMYNIFNDQLCHNVVKKKYPYPISITDFQIENMSDQEFCFKWITNPNQY